jgi:hypothetical protein
LLEALVFIANSRFLSLPPNTRANTDGEARLHLDDQDAMQGKFAGLDLTTKGDTAGKFVTALLAKSRRTARALTKAADKVPLVISTLGRIGPTTTVPLNSHCPSRFETAIQRRNDRVHGDLTIKKQALNKNANAAMPLSQGHFQLPVLS